MAFIITRSGKHFNFEPPYEFDISDIAFALSRICRFTGHVDFYSVAQHSVLASFLVPSHLALEALLHDAHEAYVGDVSAPLKALLPDYRRVEKRIEMALRQQWNLPFQTSAQVKNADLVMLATERRDLGLDDGTHWPALEHIKPHPGKIKRATPISAHIMFIARYRQLTLGPRWIWALTPPQDTKYYRVVDEFGGETEACLPSWDNLTVWVDRNGNRVTNVEWWCSE